MLFRVQSARGAGAGRGAGRCRQHARLIADALSTHLNLGSSSASARLMSAHGVYRQSVAHASALVTLRRHLSKKEKSRASPALVRTSVAKASGPKVDASGPKVAAPLCSPRRRLSCADTGTRTCMPYGEETRAHGTRGAMTARVPAARAGKALDLSSPSLSPSPSSIPLCLSSFRPPLTPSRSLLLPPRAHDRKLHVARAPLDAPAPPQRCPFLPSCAFASVVCARPARRPPGLSARLPAAAAVAPPCTPAPAPVSPRPPSPSRRALLAAAPHATQRAARPGPSAAWVLPRGVAPRTRMPRARAARALDCAMPLLPCQRRANSAKPNRWISEFSATGNGGAGRAAARREREGAKSSRREGGHGSGVTTGRAAPPRMDALGRWWAGALSPRSQPAGALGPGNGRAGATRPQTPGCRGRGGNGSGAMRPRALSGGGGAAGGSCTRRRRSSAVPGAAGGRGSRGERGRGCGGGEPSCRAAPAGAPAQRAREIHHAGDCSGCCPAARFLKLAR